MVVVAIGLRVVVVRVPAVVGGHVHQVGDEGAATSEKRNWNCYFRRNLFEIVIIYCENFANFTVHLDNFLVFVLRIFSFAHLRRKT